MLHEIVHVRVARRGPGDDPRAALVEASHSAGGHAACRRLVGVFHGAAAVVRAAHGMRLVAERAQKVDAGMDDVAMAQDIAAVPEGDSFLHVVHSLSSSSLSCSAANARTRLK